jgi:hypothetical protein
MSFLLRMQQRFFKKYLPTALPENAAPRKITNLDSAKTVGILFDATDKTTRETIVEYANQLSRSGKKVRLLGFMNFSEKKMPAGDLPFVHFNKKNLNWWGKPTSEKADAFCKEKFDLLLCLFSGENRPLEWLTARASARMKAGGALKFYQNLDLAIELNATQNNAAELIQQLEFYFKHLVVASEKKLELV